MEQVWKQTGRMPKLLEGEPVLHPAVEHLWGWFQQLSCTRGGGFGPAPLTFQELAAWANLTGIQPTPWEVEQILILDHIWLKETAKRLDKPAAPPEK